MKSLTGLDPEVEQMVHSAAKQAIAHGMPVCAAANGSGYLIDIAGGPLELISRDYWDPARLNDHSFNLMNAMGFNIFHKGGSVYAVQSHSDGGLKACSSYADHDGLVDKSTRHVILKLCSLIDEAEIGRRCEGG